MIPNLQLIAILAAFSAILAGGIYFYGRWDGSRLCEARHATKQTEKTIEVVKVYEKIDRKIPYSADRAARFQWLLDNNGQ